MRILAICFWVTLELPTFNCAKKEKKGLNSKREG